MVPQKPPGVVEGFRQRYWIASEREWIISPSMSFMDTLLLKGARSDTPNTGS